MTDHDERRRWCDEQIRISIAMDGAVKQHCVMIQSRMICSHIVAHHSEDKAAFLKQFARDAMAVADQTKPRPYCKLHDSGYEHCADQTRQEDGADERRLAVGVADVQPLPSKLSDAPAPTTDAPREHPDLRAPLEEALRLASDEHDEVFGGDLRKRESALIAWKQQARAALAASKPVVEEVVKDDAGKS